MKKILYYILLLFSIFMFNTLVYADETLILEEPVISFERPNQYGLQGYSVVKDKLFMVLEGYDDTKAIIKVYDLNNYKEITSYEYGSLGHANDVTYNSKNNKIYIIASSGSDKVFIFNGDTFQYEDSFNIGLPVRSITYIDKYDRYAVRTVASGFMYNNKFELVNKFPFIIGMNFSTDVGRQGWTYYNDIIYYASWSWVSQGGSGANILFRYDLKGNRLNNIYTQDDIGELEGIDFYNNKMILGFNGYDKTVKFYINDIPIIDDQIQKEIIVEDVEIHEKENYNIYFVIGIITIIIFLIVIFIFRHKKKVIT